MALLMNWRCEGTALDATHDFSIGDVSASAINDATIDAAAARLGTNGVRVVATAGNDARFNFNSAGLFDNVEMALGCWVRFPTTFPVSRTFFVIRDAAQNNALRLTTLPSGGNFQFEIESNNVNYGAELTGLGAVPDAWYFLLGRFNVAIGIRAEVYNTAGSLIGIGELPGEFDPPTLTADAAGLRVGFPNVGAQEAWLDNVFIANSYYEPIQNNIFNTSYTQYNGAPAALPRLPRLALMGGGSM